MCVFSFRRSHSDFSQTLHEICGRMEEFSDAFCAQVLYGQDRSDQYARLGGHQVVLDAEAFMRASGWRYLLGSSMYFDADPPCVDWSTVSALTSIMAAFQKMAPLTCLDLVAYYGHPLTCLFWLEDVAHLKRRYELLPHSRSKHYLYYLSELRQLILIRLNWCGIMAHYAPHLHFYFLYHLTNSSSFLERSYEWLVHEERSRALMQPSR